MPKKYFDKTKEYILDNNKIKDRAESIGSSVSSQWYKTSSYVTEKAGKSAEMTRGGINNTSKKIREKSVDIYELFGNINIYRFSEENLSVGKIKEISLSSSKSLSEYINKSFELNKDIDDILKDASNKNNSRPEEISDLVTEARAEVAQSIIGAFALSSYINEFDNKLSDQYENLSEDYKEFSERVNVRGHDNYRDMESIRAEKRDNNEYLEDGYTGNIGDPERSDIEHVVSAKEYFESFLFKATTTDEQFIEKINDDGNIIFTDSSLNRSKGSKDLMEWIEENGRPIDGTNNIEIEIKGNTHILDNDLITSQYQESKNKQDEYIADSFSAMGLDVASSGAVLGAKRIVGYAVYETHDVFFDEVKSVIDDGIDLSEEKYSDYLYSKASSFKDKINSRLEERGVFKKAREMGMEGFLTGTVSVLPMIFISTIIKMPVFVLHVIRECMLALVRTIRVLLSNTNDKYSTIKNVLIGSVASVIGVILFNQIFVSVSSVPGVGFFSREIAFIVSGSLIAIVSLLAVYFFVKNKDKLVGVFKKPGGTLDDEGFPA